MWLFPNELTAPFAAHSKPWAPLPAALLALLILGIAFPRGTLAQSADSASEKQAGASSLSPNAARSALSVQVGGGSYMIGLQYQYRWTDSWIVKAGIGGGPVIELFPFDDTAYNRSVLRSVFSDYDFEDTDVSTAIGMPVGASWVPGSGDWRPEVGLSVTPGLIVGETPVLWGGPSAGVRYHPRDGGLYVRAVGQRLHGTAVGEEGDGFAMWTIGLSIGYTF